MKTPLEEIEASLNVVDLHPSLEEVVRANGLNRKKLTVGLRPERDRLDVSEREEVFVYDGSKGAIWKVPSLRALLHGDQRPVSAAEFDAIFGRLAKSARTFGVGVVSRNYIAVVRQMDRR